MTGDIIMKQMYFMCEDVKLAAISFNDIGNAINVQIDKQQSHLLPFSVKNDVDLLKWIDNRKIPNTRDGISTDLKEDTTGNFLIENLGLSLTDNYWLMPQNGHYVWNDVNLFDNWFYDYRFLSVSGEVDARTPFVPSASLNGDLRKKWCIDKDGNRLLVKGNLGSTSRNSLNEVFATLLHTKQGYPFHVAYSLVKINVEGAPSLGCACENFITKGDQFIPAIDVVNSKKLRNDSSVFEHYVTICEQLGIEKGEHERHLSYMIMSDFVLSNKDRHLNNLGIIRDSNGRFRFAPLFDTGYSMFSGDEYIYTTKENLLNLTVNSFAKHEVDGLRYVKDRDVLNPRMLPTADELYGLYRKDCHIPEEILERMCKAYLSKCSLLEDFQNGKDLWKYGIKRSYFTII